ncbi:haloacid dehalogenase-like hydrolase [Lutimonas sp.]|uniref:haloacid dehalogenase-like hydrolase n=1 Tax=Lutimonas sp. TaxID=1872403 RepID=UPI003D9B1F42
MKRILLLVLISNLFLNCSRDKVDKEQSSQALTTDFLISWNDLENKQRILSFVSAATDPEDPGFIKTEDRIAVFDNDGTLWTEKPIYNHVFGVFQRFEQAVKQHPEILQDSVYLALNEFIKTNDKSELSIFMKELQEEKYNEIVGQVFGKAFEGISVEDFADWNKTYYHEWKHPVFKKTLSSLTYQPMLEFISLLQANDFKVFIFTADEGAFLKLYSKELYNVDPEHVFGTATMLEYKDGQLYRTSKGGFLNNWENKAKLIYQIVGKRPVVAAGNSNGDFHMLQYINSGKNNHLSLLIHHTDSIREFSYDSHTEHVLPYALKNNYVVIDMEKDWKTIFKQ